MKKHVARKWVKALRSDKYKQGINALQSNNTFCCLGVLCMIAPKSIEKNIEDGCLLGDTLEDQRHVLNWAGMWDTYGYIESLETQLTSLNDSGKTFSEIADIIEKHYKEL